VATDSGPNWTINSNTDLQRDGFLPLRLLAGILIGLLSSTIALTAARLAAPLVVYGGPAWKIAMDIEPIVVLSRVSLAATAIVFLIWFRRARVNAERLAWRQRRARSWAFWGWVVPIANLWIPFQIMGDIWRAGLQPAHRAGTAWLPALWWATWLLASGPGELDKDHFPNGWLGFAFFAIAGLILVVIIRAVSNGPVGVPNVHGDRPNDGERESASSLSTMRALARIGLVEQRLAATERWVGLVPTLEDLDAEIAHARREKEHAIDRQDFESAAALRDKENELFQHRTSKEKEWDAAADARISVVAELGRVNAELERLRDVLRQHGIDEQAKPA
jgi:hypothetical protein